MSLENSAFKQPNFPNLVQMASKISINMFSNLKKQAGTGPSRRHIRGSKIAKGLPSVNLRTRKSKSQKMDRMARRGPQARAPGALKRKKF